MGTVWRVLDGKKTYLTAAALGLAGVLRGLGLITEEHFTQFVQVALPAALIFLRQAVEKSTR